LVVDYEGTIDSATFDSSYTVGERVAGRLVVDTELAGNDWDPQPDVGWWGGGPSPPEEWPDFVTGFNPFDPAGMNDNLRIVNDLILRDGRQTSLDVFAVSDDLYWGRAALLTLDVRLHGLLDDAGIDQSFEVTSADVDEADESLFGEVRKPGDNQDSGAGFLITHLTVRPGRCLAQP
jgi:hypothetical protein